MTTIHNQIYLLAVFNELSNDNILDLPKLKVVKDEKSKRGKKRTFSATTEIIEEKGENGCYLHLLLSSQCSQKAYSFGTLKPPPKHCGKRRNCLL